jgi:hypothetical protein
MGTLAAAGAFLAVILQAASLSTAATKFVPGVTWRAASAVSANFSCRGPEEHAILGVTATGIVIAVFLNGPDERPEVLRYSASARDPREVKLTIEGLDYEPNQDTGPLPGFRRSRTCKGLNLSDGMVDSAHIYWNHNAKRFDDWVR